MRSFAAGACTALLAVLLLSLMTGSDWSSSGGGSGSGGGGVTSVSGGASVRGGGGAPSSASSAASAAEDGAPGGVYSQPLTARHAYFPRASAAALAAAEAPLARGALAADGGGTSARWVVLTTINPPTPAVAALAALGSDWRVVVVGDSKTPAAPWAAHGFANVVYLDLAAQRALGFSTGALLRTRAYTRKNLGYLYAVAHGARLIYETDDDNALLAPAVPELAAAGGAARVLEYEAPGAVTLNHHAHFAQPASWPRGYPLESIGEAPARALREASVLPAVQQGLANGDPDLDAIFRLTRKPHAKRVDFSFAPDAPPVALPMGAFAPWNAQNTLFTYEALWATVLPQTVEFRVCDIWRAYWAQRLLWGVGAQLVFMPASVYQLRNSHSYLEDYVSEKQIYEQVGDLVALLRAWRCAAAAAAAGGGGGAPAAADAPSLLPACAVELARDMAAAGFWGAADAELVRHFFHDLGRAGYAFPPWLERADSTHFIKACERLPGGCAPLGPLVNEPLRLLPSIELVDAQMLAAMQG